MCNPASPRVPPCIAADRLYQLLYVGTEDGSAGGLLCDKGYKVGSYPPPIIIPIIILFRQVGGYRAWCGFEMVFGLQLLCRPDWHFTRTAPPSAPPTEPPTAAPTRLLIDATDDWVPATDGSVYRLVRMAQPLWRRTASGAATESVPVWSEQGTAVLDSATVDIMSLLTFERPLDVSLRFKALRPLAARLVTPNGVQPPCGTLSIFADDSDAAAGYHVRIAHCAYWDRACRNLGKYFVFSVGSGTDSFYGGDILVTEYGQTHDIRIAADGMGAVCFHQTMGCLCFEMHFFLSLTGALLLRWHTQAHSAARSKLLAGACARDGWL